MTGTTVTALRRVVPGTGDGGGSPRSVLVVMCAGCFLVLLDVAIVNVAPPDIGSGLGTKASAGCSGWSTATRRRPPR